MSPANRSERERASSRRARLVNGRGRSLTSVAPFEGLGFVHRKTGRIARQVALGFTACVIELAGLGQQPELSHERRLRQRRLRMLLQELVEPHQRTVQIAVTRRLRGVLEQPILFAERALWL